MIRCRSTPVRWGLLALVALLMSMGAPATHAVAGQEPLALAGCFNAGGMAGCDSVGVAAGTMSASAVLTLPVALTQLPGHAPGVGALSAVAVLGVFGTGIAFWIFYTLIGSYGAARASVVAYLAPGFSLAYGAALLSEPVTAGAAGGLALILAGSWTAAEGKPPWRRRRVMAPATG